VSAPAAERAVRIPPKSRKGDPKAFLWVLMDVGGEIRACCYAAPSATVALSDGFLGNAAGRARRQFAAALGPRRPQLILPPGL
jgi:hypothetical protein